ncbi:MAG TPA: dynamin family protein, partial [Ureibacillus sp.]|nr:dynamin family protein [Ureibacillus sp.]
ALTEQYVTEIDAIEFALPFSIIEDQIHQGALLTGDALLNFANRVSEATKRYFIQETDMWKDLQEDMLNEVAQASIAPVSGKLNALTEKVTAINHILEMDDRKQFAEKQMILVNKETRENANKQSYQWKKEFEKDLQEIRLFDPSMLNSAKKEELTVESNAKEIAVEKVNGEEVIHAAIRTANAVGKINGFEEVSTYLMKKVSRLQDQDFTIALFGAFSAGKSSFSNALLGAKVLPVSPNPTTAAINKIRPATKEHPHETADVQLKTKEQLLDDIQNAYESIGLSITSLDEAFNRSEEGLQVKLTDERLNVHKSFIRAYAKGYPAYKDKLGQMIRVNRTEFELFVAEESRSCFVDNIDFYYDCPLTRMGVTLVDTPGADSINARHTGVAFDYIRNADAILFITYYNHAFAKADREFLIQLGRVKDAFELDKMFFIVNAIDLASTKDEEEDVKNYVRNELQRFGIRFPKIYGVSSLNALREKVEHSDLQSGMKPFEESFHQFLKEDLTAIAIQALNEEVEKTHQRLHGLITQTEENLLRKDERLAELKQLEEKIRKMYVMISTTGLESDVKQEIDELLYYVLQRVYYRYPDFFRESYNPSTFASKQAQVALKQALTETLDALKFDFAQELRVTNFRLAQFIQKKVQERYKEEVRNLKELNPSFSFIAYESDEPNLLEFAGPFAQYEKYENVKSYFKNAKAFFEKNEKEQLKAALEELTKPDAEKYLNDEKLQLLNWATKFIHEEAERLRKHISHEAFAQIETERLLLQEESRLSVWKEIYSDLQKAGV